MVNDGNYDLKTVKILERKINMRTDCLKLDEILYKNFSKILLMKI
jgi:hypothetical protein